MEHNRVRILVDAETVNLLLVKPNPSPIYKGAGSKDDTPYGKVIATFKKLDEDEIPIRIEKWTTAQDSKVYLIYDTMDHSIFISGVDPAPSSKRK